MFVRLVMLAIVLLLLFAVSQILIDTVRAVTARRGDDPPARTRWQSGRIPLARVPGAKPTGPGGRDDLSRILRFGESHEGVEGYVEPATSSAPRSIVLVDGDGEWSRFVLGGDRALRALIDRGIPIYDATKLGYPKRMRGGGGGGEGRDAPGR